MTTLTGSFDGATGGNHRVILPPTTEPDTTDGPSPDTLRALHDDAIRLARGRLLMALPAPFAIAVLIYVMALDPRGAWMLVGPVVALTAMLAGVVREWWHLRRADPLENWHRERREEIQESVALVEHQSRILGVTPFVSYGIAVAVAVVTGIQFMGPGVEASIELAALVKPAVRAGEWWRLLSASFLHGNLWHLIGNLGALVALGTLVEAYDRRARAPLAYLAGAIAGSLASTLLLAASSVGASAGVLGLLGFLLMAGGDATASRAWMRKGLLRLMMMIATTGLVGYFFIDNAGHAGGVLGGAFVGALSARANRIGRAWPRRLDICGYGAGVVLLAGAIFTTGRLLRAW